MPRRKRNFRLNFIHHIMFRGINGETLFLDDDDRVRFCLLLQDGCENHGIAIHGFCLMSNHIHLLLEPSNNSFSEGIHSFAFRYAQYFNQRHERKGYLYQGRFRSINVGDDIYLMRLIRYIHLNPVDAFLVELPENYPWSSYRAFLGYDRFTWLKTERVLRQFGESKQEAIAKLIDYTHQRLDAKADCEIIVKAHRKGTFDDNKNYDLIVASSEKSVQLNLTTCAEYICHNFDIRLENLISQDKSKSYVDARSVLALFSRKSKLWSLETVSELLKKNSGTISRLATRAEQSPSLTMIVENLIKQWGIQICV